ncbi:MAG: PLP-dependent aspartate aminotransferase family protein [Burkholderiales bacterium]|jgi:cystathionine gamma-synthase|nr:PLP-dependent aspartate aminotransferase family protein [Burkholderiales bacterium]
MKLETLCIHGAKDNRNTTGAVTVPIYQTATYAHPAVGESTGYDYSRVGNPTREALERLMTKLENGNDTFAFATGMAAISALMELFVPDDHIIASDNLYGGSVRLFENISRKNGLVIDYVNTCDINLLKEKINTKTKAVFVETPTNPMMRVTDIAAVRECIADDVLLIVDNTFLTPYFQRPISLGANIVVHSGTKYLGGHNDTLAGFLVVDRADIAERLHFIRKTTGACLSPFDSFLVIRGIKTLPLRMEKSQASSFVVADWLLHHSKVKAVFYPGLPNHSDFAVSKKQASGFGSILSFEVDNEQTAKQILERVKTIMYAESLGGVESLMTYPVLQTHSDISEETRNALGIHDRLLRLSVGIESTDDIIADLEQSFS